MDVTSLWSSQKSPLCFFFVAISDPGNRRRSPGHLRCARDAPMALSVEFRSGNATKQNDEATFTSNIFYGNGTSPYFWCFSSFFRRAKSSMSRAIIPEGCAKLNYDPQTLPRISTAELFKAFPRPFTFYVNFFSSPGFTRRQSSQNQVIFGRK